MLAQGSQRISAGRHGHSYRAECPCAGDVFRGITDYKNVVRGEFGIKGSLCPSFGDGAKLIPVGVIVSKSTETESIPDAVRRQLDLRSAADVAGQQTDALPVLGQYI